MAPRSGLSPRKTRFFLNGDEHEFVGRVFDLGKPIHLHFRSYKGLSRCPDCKYAYEVFLRLDSFVNRVQSINLVGNMLWELKESVDFKMFPLSRYDWLTITTDVFLMRLISVYDCALLLCNDVYEFNIDPRRCSLDKLVVAGMSPSVSATLKGIRSSEGKSRDERNWRFHRGYERIFSDDDATFHMAATFEYVGRGLTGEDRKGRPIDLRRMFSNATLRLKREHNKKLKLLSASIDKFYDAISPEFESRFVRKLRSRKKLKLISIDPEFSHSRAGHKLAGIKHPASRIGSPAKQSHRRPVSQRSKGQ